MSETETVPNSTETTTARPKPQGLDITEIMAILPHRYPFLLIDRVLEIERRERIVAIKNVTANEPQFMGHFPGNPIMPGVLMIESMAQAGGALLLTEYEDRDQKIMYFTGIEGAKFRRPVTPGDQMRIEIKVLNWRSRAVKMAGTITVDGKLVCEATISCGLVDKASGGAVPKPAAPAETAE
jgi:3-hydroxyacyl-[acyl-carrier-protein] dehydratase